MEAEPTPLSEHERLKAMVHDLSLRLEDLQQGRKRYSTTVVNQTSSASSAKAPYWSCELVDDGDLTLGATTDDWDADIEAFTGTTVTYKMATGDGFLSLPVLSAGNHNRCWIVFENPGSPFTATMRLEAADGGANSYVQVKLNTAMTAYGGSAGLDTAITWSVPSGRNRISLVQRSNESGDAYKFVSLKGAFLSDSTTWVDGNE